MSTNSETQAGAGESRDNALRALREVLAETVKRVRDAFARDDTADQLYAECEAGAFLRTHGDALLALAASQPAAETGSTGALSDASCDAIVRALDKWARDTYGSYEFGLPTWDENCFIVQRHVIRSATPTQDAAHGGRG